MMATEWRWKDHICGYSDMCLKYTMYMYMVAGASFFVRPTILHFSDTLASLPSHFNLKL